MLSMTVPLKDALMTQRFVQLLEEFYYLPLTYMFVNLMG